MPIYTVSQISEAIKKTLEGSFPTLQIRGEISNLRLQSSGHFYFTLKDATSQLSCALFRTDASKLKSTLKDGDQIIASGNLSVFTPKGSYQLIVKSIEHQGLGDLLAKLEALKMKFQQMGYFEAARKKAIPRFAQTIGVITSPTGAVIQDIIHTLSRRHRGFKLILCPVKVQGDGASDEIVTAIEFMNKHALCDLLIVGRGGGSLEDLWCFNEEKLVKAIYDSQIPIISAVGHETDFTLADFVADVRAPTPTAAAEMALVDLKDFIAALHSKFDAIKKLFARKIQSDKRLLEQLKKRPELTSSSSLLQSYYFHIDRIQSRLQQLFQIKFHRARSDLEAKCALLKRLNPQNQLREKKFLLNEYKVRLGNLGKTGVIDKKHKLEALYSRLTQSLHMLLKNRASQLELTTQLLNSINPEAVLDKGYALMLSLDGTHIYTSITQIQEADDLRVKVKDGSCVVNVKSKSLI